MFFDKVDKIIALVFGIGLLVIAGLYIDGHYLKADIAEIKDENLKIIQVTVSGEVEKPGTYSVPEGSRIYDVLYAAGGVTDRADTEIMDLDARVIAKTNILVPSIDSPDSKRVFPVVNINSADKNELMIIPGVGEVMAERIVNYRSAYGEFLTKEDIKKVRGIGDKTFESIKDYITIK